MAERVASPVFVGRRAELAALEAALAQPERTAGVLVAGEAGAGKSRLVAEFTTAATAAGARVLTGACVALGAESLPYAPFMGVLGQLAAEVGPDGIEDLVGSGRVDLARLVPELRRPGDDFRPSGPAERAVLFQVVLRTLEALGARAPLVVVVEDLHWADASSRELLAFLIGRLAGGVLIVATYRNDEVHRRHPLRPFLAEAARSERVTRVDLAPLTPDEVTRQLEAIAGSTLPPAVVEAVVGRAEGNPFFAEELLAAGGGGALPPDLAEVLTARLSALPVAAQTLVGVVAVAGLQVGHELLSAAAGDDPDIAAGLREAISHQVLVVGPDGGYAFRHALLAEAAYAELLPSERTTLHAAFAAALAAHPEWATTRGGAAGELAHHYAAAHDRPRALGASVAAAAAAAETYAFAEAHGLYEQALRLWDEVPQAPALTACDRAELLQRAADAAVLAGATERAITLVRFALDELDAATEPARASLLHEFLARLLWRSGRGEASLAASRAAVALMPAEATAERARVIGGDARTLMLAGRYQESRARSEEAVAVARAAGARREEGDALNTLGADLGRLGEPEQAAALLGEALVMAKEAGSIEDVWRAYANLGTTLGEAGQLERAAAVELEGVRYLQDLRYDEGAAHLRSGAAQSMKDSGAWAEAERLATELLDGTPSDITVYRAHMVAGVIAVRRGQFASAHAHLTEARVRREGCTDADVRGAIASAMAELATAEGSLEEARRLVQHGLDALGDSDAQHQLLQLVALGLRVEADARNSRSGRNADSTVRNGADLIGRVQSMAKSGRRLPVTRQGLALTALCEAEAARGRGEREPTLWDQVARAWAALSHPYETAYARWRQSQALLGIDAKEDAVVTMREAFSVASRLGAAPLIDEIERLARRARVRLTADVDGHPARPPGNVMGLTRRELDVLALVAAGHTNRQIAEALFMSDKTASVHVSRIITKLGVANRGQAAALAHRLKLFEERSTR